MFVCFFPKHTNDPTSKVVSADYATSHWFADTHKPLIGWPNYNQSFTDQAPDIHLLTMHQLSFVWFHCILYHINTSGLLNVKSFLYMPLYIIYAIRNQIVFWYFQMSKKSFVSILLNRFKYCCLTLKVLISPCKRFQPLPFNIINCMNADSLFSHG